MEPYINRDCEDRRHLLGPPYTMELERKEASIECQALTVGPSLPPGSLMSAFPDRFPLKEGLQLKRS